MHEFRVVVWKTNTYHAEVEVDADNLEQAEKIAERMAERTNLIKWLYIETETGSVAFLKKGELA